MTFKDQLSNDLDAVFHNTDEFAISLTTSASVTINGILDYAQNLSDYELNGQIVLASLRIKVSDVATPERYQTYSDGTHTWRIENIVSGDGYEWVCTVSRDQRAS